METAKDCHFCSEPSVKECGYCGALLCNECGTPAEDEDGEDVSICDDCAERFAGEMADG